MKKIATGICALMLAVGVMVPVMSNAENPDGHSVMYVDCANGGPLMVRYSPTKNSKVLYRAANGSKLEIAEPSSDGWVLVRQDGKPYGFVMTKFLKGNKPNKYALTEKASDFKAVTPYTVTAKARAKNTNESVGLRTQPTKKSAAIRRLMAGDQLQVIEVGKTWSKVIDPQTGLTGYVANDYMMR